MSTPTQDCTLSLSDRIKMRYRAFERDPVKIAEAVGTSPAYVSWVIKQEAKKCNTQ